MSININIIFFIKISNNSLSFLSAHSMDDLQGRWAKLSLNTKETQMVNLSTNIVENSRSARSYYENAKDDVEVCEKF